VPNFHLSHGTKKVKRYAVPFGITKHLIKQGTRLGAFPQKSDFTEYFMKRVKSFILLIFLTFNFEAFSKISQREIDDTISKTINYLVNIQVNETVGTKQFKGEWGSIIEFRGKVLVAPFEKGYSVYDSNCFTTASTFVSLAEIYLNYYRSEKLVKMLQLALTDVMACEKEGTFGFWHEVELPSFLHEPGKINVIRGPNHLTFDNRLLFMAMNIFNDADDTAVAYLAISMAKQIESSVHNFIAPDFPLPFVGETFQKYRDVNRFSLNIHDRITLRPMNTGAFMTWFGAESFFPKFPSSKKVNIPFSGINNVDCVVNANVLTSLHATGELDTTVGVGESCEYVNKSIKKWNRNRCAAFYPNKYSFPYSLSRAINRGVMCLEKSKDYTIKLLLKEQRRDGSWSSFRRKDDLIHSTALAVNSLIYLFDQKLETKNAINRGLKFLLSNKSISNNEIFWKGGILFSGGTVLKNRIVWKSNAYTTSLVLKALIKTREL